MLATWRESRLSLNGVVSWTTMNSFLSPDYPNAPLIEVALSAQFQPLPQYTTAHAGAFWQLVKDEFPLAQENPPLPIVNEFFGGNRPNMDVIDFGVNFGFPSTRMWFVSADGSLLIQIQRNRFVFNWRKTDQESRYPRYEFVRENFIRYFELFKKFITESSLGNINVDLFEAHYVNQWPLESDKTFGQVIGGWLELAPPNVASLEMEQATISVQYLVKSDQNQPIGRMHVNVVPILAMNGQYGVNLELICRVIPLDLGDKLEFAPLDLAREKIVTTFTQITSDSAQQFWRGT
jgi:uncharacterized protein (TIGR04255 family)